MTGILAAKKGDANVFKIASYFRHLVVQGVKTVPHNAAGAGSIPQSRELKPHMSSSQNTSRNNTVTNLAKTLKMVHMEKIN